MLLPPRTGWHRRMQLRQHRQPPCAGADWPRRAAGGRGWRRPREPRCVGLLCVPQHHGPHHERAHGLRREQRVLPGPQRLSIHPGIAVHPARWGPALGSHAAMPLLPCYRAAAGCQRGAAAAQVSVSGRPGAAGWWLPSCEPRTPLLCAPCLRPLLCCSGARGHHAGRLSTSLLLPGRHRRAHLRGEDHH
jgi:hypothetical protein